MPTSTNKFVCPVDFSEGSERALDKAVELAGALGAQLELVHVYQAANIALPGATAISVERTLIDELGKQSQKALDEALSKLRARAPNLQVNAHLLEGTAADTIVSFAEKVGASMIVVGTHGRRGFQRFLLGSVAERLVRTSPIPVLTVQLSDKGA